jgi:hypothetical protein
MLLVPFCLGDYGTFYAGSSSIRQPDPFTL